MIQDTSIESYHQAIDSGVVATQQRAVLEAIRQYPDRTSGEICDILINDWHFKNFPQTRARFTELRTQGKVTNSGKKHCAITGRKCLTWRIAS